MKKYLKIRSFTLLELIIVIIIIGVLAILGFTQYGRMVERARGAEARAILGDIRKLAYAYRMEQNTLAGILPANVNIGAPGTVFIPNSCAQASHFFSYAIAAVEPVITITATRCVFPTGKAPGLPAGPAVPQTLILTSNLASGVDGWAGTGGY